MDHIFCFLHLIEMLVGFLVQAADGVAFLMRLYGAIINVIPCGGLCEFVVVKQ